MNTFDRIAKQWISELKTYEPGKPIEEVARELGFETADEIVKVASNENALGPSPLALEAMRAAAPHMHRYPDGGAYYLRQGIARKLDIAADQVIVANGSNELLEFLGHVFLEEGSAIVMADHAFLVYRLIAASCRSTVIEVPMKNLTHNPEAMKAAVTPDTRIVFVSNPNNPTGTMVAQTELDRFMDGMPEHVVVALDEAYMELLPPEMQPDSLRFVREDRNVVLLRTFSKSYGLAGLRIGYAIAPENCIRLLHHVRQPFNANAMAQAAALAALDDDDHLSRTRQMIKNGLSYLENECRRMELPFVPSVVNFMLVEVGNGRKVFEDMQRQQVIVRPMDVYGLPNYVRVTVGTPEENERCITALEKVLH